MTMDLARPQCAASDTSFLKTALLFPLALGNGAERNGMSIAKQVHSSRHFQRGISEFCEMRNSPIASKQVLDNIRLYLVSLIGRRLRFGKTVGPTFTRFARRSRHASGLLMRYRTAAGHHARIGCRLQCSRQRTRKSCLHSGAAVISTSPYVREATVVTMMQPQFIHL